jgi:hypothetical protein
MQDKIKEELLKEIYGNIDRLYDHLEQHFELSSAHEELAIRELNKLKDQLFLIVTHSKLS